MDRGTEVPHAEFKKYTSESFGQLLKISASLSPEYFPYKVELPADSQFFADSRDRLLNGGGEAIGQLIERSALIGADDIGTLMLSKKIFRGNFMRGLTKLSAVDFDEHLNILTQNIFPPGWRTFGFIHSHPLFDVVNQVAGLPFPNVPKLNGVAVSFSGGDFVCFLDDAKYANSGLTTFGMINATQISLMVATSETIKKLNNPDDVTKRVLKTWFQGLPPYRSFSHLGILLYAGNHFGKKKGVINLERLI